MARFNSAQMEGSNQYNLIDLHYRVADQPWPRIKRKVPISYALRGLQPD